MKFVTYRDKLFIVDEGVLEPKKDAFLFYEHMIANEGDIALDLGTGTGFYAIMLADKYKKVVATDINKRAVRNARKNVIINDVEDKVELLQGDMFEPLEDKKFDLIVSSLPQMPVPEWKVKEGLISIADDGGLNGRGLVDRFVRGVKSYLNRNGKVYLYHFEFLDTQRTLRMLEEEGLDASIAAQLEFPPGRLTSERIDHLKSLGYNLNCDKTKGYVIKVDIVTAIKKD